MRLLILLAFLIPPSLAQAQMKLIDDFETPGTASLGGRWQLSTDRVMGGVSTGRASYGTWQGNQGLLLQGQVSTANNGGFVQVSLPFAGGLDASAYRGVELKVRGNDQTYQVHLRDRSTRWPWQVYRADYATDGTWQTIHLPFEAFTRSSGRGALDPGNLRRIGLVAGYDDFQAELIVTEVRLY